MSRFAQGQGWQDPVNRMDNRGTYESTLAISGSLKIVSAPLFHAET